MKTPCFVLPFMQSRNIAIVHKLGYRRDLDRCGQTATARQRKAASIASLHPPGLHDVHSLADIAVVAVDFVVDNVI